MKCTQKERRLEKEIMITNIKSYIIIYLNGRDLLLILIV